MKLRSVVALAFILVSTLGVSEILPSEQLYDFNKFRPGYLSSGTISLGDRPNRLLRNMDTSPLKEELKACDKKPLNKSAFSIAHRGAPRQFPEHTKESYEAAAMMGAGIIECDVTFTKDRELVCRHSQCDLHTTTNILATTLADKCSTPFTPAVVDELTGRIISPATANCCTSDITLSEFKALRGKQDTYKKNARTIDEYMNIPNGSIDSASVALGTLLTHAESIELFKRLNVKMIPELKRPKVQMPFGGDYTQEQYAQQVINEYKAANVPPEHVWLQSFSIKDIQYWLAHEPEFAKQAVFLYWEKRNSTFNFRDPNTFSAHLQELKEMGLTTIANPIWMLLDLDSNEAIIPSAYATAAKQAGFNLITGPVETATTSLDNGGGWFYHSISKVLNDDSDIYKVLDALAQDVGITGVFSDWPATVTYYANCKEL